MGRASPAVFCPAGQPSGPQPCHIWPVPLATAHQKLVVMLLVHHSAVLPPAVYQLFVVAAALCLNACMPQLAVWPQQFHTCMHLNVHQS